MTPIFTKATTLDGVANQGYAAFVKDIDELINPTPFADPDTIRTAIKKGLPLKKFSIFNV